MGWVPEGERKTVWYLLEPKFLVRVPQMAQRSVDDIKLFGTPTSGNEFVDRELAKNDNVCMLNIATMEDMYHRGFKIGVVNYKDTEKIYEYISNHLIAFKNLMQNSQNFNPDPSFFDELIRLDQFASAVYDKAKFVMTKDIVHSMLSRRFKTSSLSQMTGASLMTVKQAADEKEEKAAVSGARNYGTNLPAPQVEQSVEDVKEEIDNRYPKRISMQQMFEQQKKWGDARWK